MITETGRVVAVEQDCLWVETIQSSTCDSCSAQKGCGQSLIAKWDGNTSFIRVLLQGRDPEDYRFHDTITVGIPEQVVANGSLLVYLTPLLVMMAGLMFGHWMQLGEGANILLALLGLVAGGLLVRLHSAVHRDDERVQPVIVDDMKPVNWG